METCDHILQKEVIYREQMVPVRELVLRFFEAKGWSPMSRGRRAHVSVFGPIGDFNGVVDIQMEETDWNRMPTALQPETPFLLGSNASLERDNARLFLNRVLLWRTTFQELPTVSVAFIAEAWSMLSQLTHADVVEQWPGPAGEPDEGPGFGPPRVWRA